MVTARQITNGRRFGNATLDAILDNLVAYNSLRQAALPFSDQSPNPNPRNILHEDSESSTSVTEDTADGVSLDGSSSYLLGPIPQFQVKFKTPYTINFFVKPSDLSAEASGIAIAIGPEDGSSLRAVNVEDDGTAKLRTSSNNFISGSPGDLADNTLSMITIIHTWSGGTGTMALYVDNVLIGSSTNNGGATMQPDYGIFFGRTGFTLNNALAGNYRDISYWNTALGSTERAALWNSGSPRYLQGAGL